MQSFFILFGYIDISDKEKPAQWRVLVKRWVEDLGSPLTGRLDTFHLSRPEPQLCLVSQFAYCLSPNSTPGTTPNRVQLSCLETGLLLPTHVTTSCYMFIIIASSKQKSTFLIKKVIKKQGRSPVLVYRYDPNL